MLLDCPASSELLQFNGLAACDEVLLPVGADHMSLLGAQRFLQQLHRLTERTNVRPRLLGLLPTLYDVDAASTGPMERRLRKEYAGALLHSRIRLADDLRRAPVEKGSVFDIAPLSPAAMDYSILTQEILSLAA